MGIKGLECLKRAGEFSKVQRQGFRQKTHGLTLKAAPNNLELCRWGFIVSRKVGTAVTRNRIRRVLKEIVCQVNTKPGFDVVLIAHPEVANMDFQAVKSRLCLLLEKAGLVYNQ